MTFSKIEAEFARRLAAELAEAERVGDASAVENAVLDLAAIEMHGALAATRKLAARLVAPHRRIVEEADCRAAELEALQTTS